MKKSNLSNERYKMYSLKRKRISKQLILEPRLVVNWIKRNGVLENLSRLTFPFEKRKGLRNIMLLKSNNQ